MMADRPSDREAFERWMIDVRKCVVGSSDPYPAGIERDAWQAWKAGADFARELDASGGGAVDDVLRAVSLYPLPTPAEKFVAFESANGCQHVDGYYTSRMVEKIATDYARACLLADRARHPSTDPVAFVREYRLNGELHRELEWSDDGEGDKPGAYLPLYTTPGAKQ